MKPRVDCQLLMEAHEHQPSRIAASALNGCNKFVFSQFKAKKEMIGCTRSNFSSNDDDGVWPDFHRLRMHPNSHLKT